MKDLLRIASLLDNSGQFRLSDKLFKIAQSAQFEYKLNSDNPNNFFENLVGYQNSKNLKNFTQSMNSYAAENATYKGILIKDIPAFQQYYLDLQNNYPSDLSQLIEDFEKDPSKRPQKKLENLPGQNTPYKYSAQTEADKFQDKRYFLINTTDPATFAKSLFQYGSMYGINNLTQAFDAYADAGASYQGNLIKNVPVLRELYMRVRNTKKMIQQEELAKELAMLTTPQRTTLNNDVMTKKDSEDLGTYWYKAVKEEPLIGLETLKTEVQKDQELNESQKTNLINIIDQRIKNRR